MSTAPRPLKGTLVDPIFGTASLHVAMKGKPLARTERASAADPDPCPFCLMALDVQNGLMIANDGDVARDILGSNQEAFTVQNRWSAFSSPSTCDLVIPFTHVEGLEDLTNLELDGFLAELLDQQTRRDATKLTSASFINVGAAAGGSLTHLHGQVVYSSAVNGISLKSLEANSLDADWALARQYDLTLADDSEARAWVAPSSTFPGEVRIDSKDLGSTSIILASIVSHFKTVPYNVLVRHYLNRCDGTLRCFMQVIPRVGSGIVYPELFGLTIVTSELADWATLLRSKESLGK